MINKLKSGLLIVLMLTVFGVANYANAAALTWGADQTIDLSSPDINLTILSGSEATSLQVGTGTFTVVVPNGDTFTVTSADRTLSASGNNTATVANSCVSGVETIYINGGTGAESVVVTPGSAQCTSSNAGGSSGGGSNRPRSVATPAVPANTTPPVDCLAGYKFSPSTGRSCNAATPATPASPSNSNNGNAYAFGTVLVKMGTKGEACKAWQMFLNDKASAGLVTDGWCGKLTITAAKAWQASAGLTADGVLGPMSRAKAK